jgi:SLOG cluster3 family
MIHSTPFEAAVFIGGMDGLFEEWTIFTSRYPDAPAFPVASTEGAARIIWTNWNPRNLPNTVADLRTRLDQDLQYRILFRDILG